jgi:hypothetical protein
MKPYDPSSPEEWIFKLRLGFLLRYNRFSMAGPVVVETICAITVDVML